jgi:hypothetical protein
LLKFSDVLCNSETRPLALREEHKSKVFMKIFASNTEELIRELKTLYNEEFCVYTGVVRVVGSIIMIV